MTTRKLAPADPLAVVCPACQARPYLRCTAPTDFTRRPVDWVHLARQDAADNAPRWSPQT